jgi:TonB family protein
MHLLFISAFIAIPKPDYMVNRLIDISFLLHSTEKEIQLLPTKIIKNTKEYSKPVEHKKIVPLEKEITAQHPKIEQQPPALLPAQSSMSGIQTTEGGVLDVTGSISQGNDGFIASHLSGNQSEKSQGDIFKAASGYVVKTVTNGEYAVHAPKEGAPDMSGIIDAFRRRVESAKQYPYMAKRKGIEGTVVLIIGIARDGSLLDMDVKKSSGYEILDNNAVSLIKAVLPFVHNLGRDIKIEIPITYRLVRQKI